MSDVLVSLSALLEQMHAFCHWRITYQDGAVIEQYNGDGNEAVFPTANYGLIRKFELVNHGQALVTLHLDGEKRLIYRRRVEQNMSNGQIKEVAYLAGWRAKDRRQLLCVLREDGSVEVSDVWLENHDWLYSFQLAEHELFEEEKTCLQQKTV